MPTKLSTPPMLIMIAIGVLTGCQLIAPGASPTASPAGSLDPQEAFSTFAQCMRDNGVPDFPDPTDDGIILDRTEVDIDSPTFQAAEEACESLLPQPPAGANNEPVQIEPINPGDSAWVEIVPGGDCACADGSEFAFWVRPADLDKVVLFLEGGGACWDATTCAFTDDDSTTYDWNVTEDDHPAFRNGIFDLSNPNNPIADYSLVYVPYCTGDVHLGDVTREYSPELTVEHNGFVNGTTALAYLTEHYPDADQVVVAGVSAGAVAAPVYAGLLFDALPDAQFTVLADGSGAYPDDPNTNSRILGQWGLFETMPQWEVNDRLTAQDWGIPKFWVQAGLHNPKIVMARFDFAFDETQVGYMTRVGLDTSNLSASIAANEAAIEEAGVVQHSYTAPGDQHTIINNEAFYTMEVNGVTLLEWVKALIAGEPLDDVHCHECTTE